MNQGGLFVFYALSSFLKQRDTKKQSQCGQDDVVGKRFVEPHGSGLWNKVVLYALSGRTLSFHQAWITLA